MIGLIRIVVILGLTSCEDGGDFGGFGGGGFSGGGAGGSW